MSKRQLTLALLFAKVLNTFIKGMRKPKYVFNPINLQYEIEKRTIKQKLLRFTGFSSLFLASFGIFFYILSSVFVTPREAALLREIEHMNFIFQDMGNQMEEMSVVLENIQDRDATVHRVMFGMDPLDEAVWDGGVGGHEKYTDFLQYDRAGQTIKEVSEQADALERKLALQSISLDTIENLALDREDRLSSIPSIKPVRQDKLKRKLGLLSGFGMRIHPIDKVRKMHYGIDFTAPRGSAIHATGNGKVIEAKKSKSGFGNRVVIDHGYGYTSLYAHMSEISVEIGDEIKKGETIGTVGNTGRSTAPHCHYEVHLNGTPVNPIYYCHDGLTPEEYKELVKRASITNQSFD